MIHKHYFIPIFFIILAGFAGCEEDELPPGSISFSWMVGTQGCGVAGVEQVSVHVEGDSSFSDLSEIYRCRDGEGTIQGVPEGAYKLIFEGLDGGGKKRFGAVEENIRVHSNSDTDIGNVRLSALKVDIIVTWYFDNARMCAANNVSEIEITLFRDEYSIASNEVDCRNGEAIFSQVEADTYTVDLVALDDTGHVLFHGQQTVTAEMGDELQLEIPLQ